MTPILTITLNPAVDAATTAPKVFPGAKLRCSAPVLDPGGGGINVARAVRLLGGDASAMVAIGGATGAQLLELLAFEGVHTVAIQGPGETRRSFSVIDESSGEQYRFVMPGPEWSEKDVARALAGVERASGAGTLVVLSGSQPPGVAKDFPSILAAHVADHGAQLIVDTSGPALRHLAEARHAAVHVLRMNGPEAEDLAGRAMPDAADTAAFARELVELGAARHVIVARGKDGSVLATARGAWHAVAPTMGKRSAVGAGDSFVGAYTLWASRGEPDERCLCAGVAAAAAAYASDGTRLCDPDVTREAMERTKLTRL